jgi:DNA-binding cell septation regulator SpoVG
VDGGGATKSGFSSAGPTVARRPLQGNPPRSPDIEILAIKPCAIAGNVKAFVDLRIDQITVSGCKIVAQADQKPWVAMPDRSWTDGDGKTRWTKIVGLERDLHFAVQAAVLDAWERGG